MSNAIGERIARNSLSSVGGQMALKVLSFAYGIAVIRQLGDESFGQYATVVALVGILAIFADLGMANFVVRSIAQDHSRVRDLFGNMLCLRLLLGVVVCFGNVGLAYALGYDPTMLFYVGLASVGLLLYFGHGSLSAVLQGFERIDKTVRLNVINQVVIIAVGGVLLALGWGIVGVFVASYCGVVVITVLAWRMARQITPLEIRADVSGWLPLIRAGLPFAITSFATMLSFRVDTVLLSLWRSSAEVGWYNVAYSLIFALLGLASSFNSALVPSLSRQYLTDPEAVGVFYARTVRLLWAAVLPIAVGTSLLAERIVIFLYGAEFAPAGAVLRVLIWVLPVLTITALCGAITTVFHRERSTARINLINATFNIALNLWAIPRYGLMGAAVLTVATELVGFSQYMLLLRDVFPLRYLGRSLAAPLIAVAAMAAFVVLGGGLHLLLIIPCAAVIYCVVLLATGAVKIGELQTIGGTVVGVALRRATTPKKSEATNV